VQAGERTSHLFRLANFNGGFVVGTGDLSELALGWSTYGVGDHMSHYNVNASVPKTLIKHLVRWVAASGSVERGDDPVLDEILATQISPELVPGDGIPRAGQPEQSSEASVGPYELQDFHLYQILRYGYAPTKVAFLAWTAWHDAGKGDWPDAPDVRATPTRSPRSRSTCERSAGASSRPASSSDRAFPNAPKVGSGGSLSPRGDWRAPSDSRRRVARRRRARSRRLRRAQVGRRADRDQDNIGPAIRALRSPIRIRRSARRRKRRRASSPARSARGRARRASAAAPGGASRGCG
jgi:NAD+ synthase (glutamine-hydrolysing)